jgi:hypothetical protein
MMSKRVSISDGNENDSINNQNIKNVEWSYDNEELLAEWCDIAQCYKWLYGRTYTHYARLHAWYTIPSIVFSTISGTASFAQTSLPSNIQLYAPMVIGTINIIIGILATVQQYLKISELKESHRIATVAWDKFSRNISIELAKAPDERISAGEFLKSNRQEFDRLMENNQIIPIHIIKKFNRIFKGRTDEEKHKFGMITKPDICDTITSIHEKRHLWFSAREDGTINKCRSNSRQSTNDYTLPRNEKNTIQISRTNSLFDIFKKESTSDYDPYLPRPNKIQFQLPPQNIPSHFSPPPFSNKKPNISGDTPDIIPPSTLFKPIPITPPLNTNEDHKDDQEDPIQ